MLGIVAIRYRHSSTAMRLEAASTVGQAFSLTAIDFRLRGRNQGPHAECNTRNVFSIVTALLCLIEFRNADDRFTTTSIPPAALGLVSFCDNRSHRCISNSVNLDSVSPRARGHSEDRRLGRIGQNDEQWSSLADMAH